jgi:hypothetical protein
MSETGGRGYRYFRGSPAAGMVRPFYGLYLINDWPKMLTGLVNKLWMLVGLAVDH